MTSQELQTEFTSGPGQRIPWWLSLASAGLPSVVGFQIVSNLLRGNSHELDVLGVPWLPIVASFLILWLILFTVSHWGGRLGKCVWAFCCGYAVFWLLRDIIFPLPLGVLDGTSPLVPPSFGYVLAEASTFLIAFGLLLVLARKKTATVLSIFVVVLGVSDVYNANKIYRKFRKNFSQQPERIQAKANAKFLAEADAKFLAEADAQTQAEAISKPIPPTLDRRPDIYQILFDRYQTVEHEVLRETGDGAPYDDFICFKNNLANYSTTYFSVPSMMTSTHYDPNLDVGVWHNSYKRKGLLKVLKEFGYRVEAFGLYPHEWDSPYVDYSRCTSEIAWDPYWGGGPTPLAVMLKLRVLPSFVGSQLFHRGEIRTDVRPPQTDFPYYCTIKFREMVDRIKDQKKGGNYVFVHMCLPHPPYVMDEHGHYVGRGKGTRMGQVRLADKLTGELIAELKRLGRYDESLIMVHADTGSMSVDSDLSRQLPYHGKELKTIDSWPLSQEIRQDGSKYPRDLVKAFSQALLLIKPPHHQGYRVDESPSQLMDIPPTIMGVLGAEQAKNLFRGGVDLLTQPPAEDRVRKTYALIYRPSFPYSINIMQEWRVLRGQFEKRQVFRTKSRLGRLSLQTD